jgi:putative iron-dependent peroxidase
MSSCHQPQSAIVPEAGPFALFTLIKIKANHADVLATLQSLPSRVSELNLAQPGANLTLSIAFTRAFWSQLNVAMPDELIDFTPLGQGDVVAPSSDVDVLIHCHTSRHDLLFYLFRNAVADMAESIDIVDETYCYRYLDARDMTGFIDGTENPKDEARHSVAIIGDGPFAGGSYVMVQRFIHTLPAWNRLNISAQEKVIGRTKPDSVELDKVPAQSHVGRVDIKENGKGLKIVRHSLPYGTVSGDHGLLFSAYCNTLHNFSTMLNSMYGVTDGKTDQLLRFTHAVTGAYFFAPSQSLLADLSIA